MKTSKSTKECNEFNTANADAIAAGMVEAIEPNEEVLACEAKERQGEEAERKEKEAIAAIVKELDMAERSDVRLDFEKTHSGGGTWSRGYHTGWRLYVGGRYGSDKKWIAIGEGTVLKLTARQKEKALAKIAEVAGIKKAQQDRRTAEEAALARYKELYNTNKELIKGITGQSHVSEYGEQGFHVWAVGRITYKYETYTIAQWEQIVALKREQAAAMKALKDSFKQQ